MSEKVCFNRKNTFARILTLISFTLLFFGIIIVFFDWFLGGYIAILAAVPVLISDFSLSKKPEFFYIVYVFDDYLMFDLGLIECTTISRKFHIVLDFEKQKKIILVDPSDSENSLTLDFDQKLLKFLEKIRVRNF